MPVASGLISLYLGSEAAIQYVITHNHRDSAVRFITVRERAVKCDVAGARVLLREDAQRCPSNVYRISIEAVVGYGWTGQRIRVEFELLTYRC